MDVIERRKQRCEAGKIEERRRKGKKREEKRWRKKRPFTASSCNHFMGVDLKRNEGEDTRKSQ